MIKKIDNINDDNYKYNYKDDYNDFIYINNIINKQIKENNKEILDKNSKYLYQSRTLENCTFSKLVSPSDITKEKYTSNEISIMDNKITLLNESIICNSKMTNKYYNDIKKIHKDVLLKNKILNKKVDDIMKKIDYIESKLNKSC